MTKKVRVLCFCIVIVLISLCVAVMFKEELFLFFKKTFFKETYQIEYSQQVEKASVEFGVPVDLIYAVIKTESNFNPDAVSSAGAVGLMQLIPETYSWVAKRLGENENIELISDPDTNIRYGTYYLKFLTDRFKSDEAIYAAYNAGYARVNGWLSDSRYSSDGINLDNIPYKETKAYVKKVSEARAKYKEAYNGDNTSSNNQ